MASLVQQPSSRLIIASSCTMFKLLFLAFTISVYAIESSLPGDDSYFANTGVYDLKGCPGMPSALALTFGKPKATY
jgi:hypothetical protein